MLAGSNRADGKCGLNAETGLTPSSTEAAGGLCVALVGFQSFFRLKH